MDGATCADGISLEQHAAEEFAGYVAKITGVAPRVEPGGVCTLKDGGADDWVPKGGRHNRPYADHGASARILHLLRLVGPAHRVLGSPEPGEAEAGPR